MADDIASLMIRIDSLEAQVADQRLGKLGRTGKSTERATDGLTQSFKRLAAPLAGIVSISAGLNKLFEVTRQFQSLNVQLATATGSAESAGVALDLIRAYAEDTKQPIADVSQAFVKLKNLGLDPSERALTSYGNTAAAMGKSLDQLIEAVADAATGEFERLKEFGIKSSTEGDRVKFTFQGVTTEVAKSSEAIEGYLQSLGENQFAGALTEQAKTLEGQLADLGNNWDDLFQTISEQGADDLMTEAFQTANDALKRFTLSIASGELEGYINAIGGKFDGFASDVINAFSILEELFKNEFQLFEDTGTGAIDALGDAFFNLPENIRAFIQLAATEVAYFVDRVGIFADELAHDMNPKNWFGDDSEFEGRINARIEAANQARLTSIETILAERDAKVEASAAEIEGVNATAEAYKKLQEAKLQKAQDEGGLGQFQLDAGGGEGGESSDSKADKFAEEMELLRASLEIENATYEEAYNRRQELLINLFNKSKIDEQKFHKESLKNTVSFLKAKDAAEKDSAEQRLAIANGFYQSGLTIASAAFGKSKQFSKAIGAVKTIESVISSYARGAEIGGPPLGAAYATAAFAAQQASQSKMDSVTIGGGSLGGLGGSSVPPAPPTLAPTQDEILQNQVAGGGSVGGQGQPVQFIFNGPVNQAENLIEIISEQLNEKDYVLFDATSRQAQIVRDSQ